MPEKPDFIKPHQKLPRKPMKQSSDKCCTIVRSNVEEQDVEKLYELIWRRFIACQMNPSVYDETTIDVSAGKIIYFRASRADNEI